MSLLYLGLVLDILKGFTFVSLMLKTYKCNFCS